MITAFDHKYAWVMNPHGLTVYECGDQNLMCSFCGQEIWIDEDTTEKDISKCPSCGADMGVEE